MSQRTARPSHRRQAAAGGRKSVTSGGRTLPVGGSRGGGLGAGSRRGPLARRRGAFGGAGDGGLRPGGTRFRAWNGGPGFRTRNGGPGGGRGPGGRRSTWNSTFGGRPFDGNTLGRHRGFDDRLDDFLDRLHARNNGLLLVAQKNHPGNGFEFTEVKSLADVQLRDIDVDEGRQVLRQAADADGMGGDFEHAALVLHAERFTGHVHRHVDLHILIGLHLVQVDMEVAVGHGVTLHFLQDGQRIVPGALEFDEGGVITDGFHQPEEFRTVE